MNSTNKARLIDTIGGLVIISAVIWFIVWVYKVNKKLDLEKQQKDEAIAERMADPSYYTPTTLQEVDKNADWFTGGDELENLILLKIPMVIWSCDGMTCEVWNGSKLKNGTITAYAQNLNIAEQLKDLYYSEKAFYGYCRLQRGKLTINFIDFK